MRVTQSLCTCVSLVMREKGSPLAQLGPGSINSCWQGKEEAEQLLFFRRPEKHSTFIFCIKEQQSDAIGTILFRELRK